MPHKHIMIFISLFLFTLSTQASETTDVDERFFPENYVKYEIQLDKENLNLFVFKVNREEPHLNPLHFQVYAQCSKTGAFYKIKREFGKYDNALTYCKNIKPEVQKIKDKSYLALSFMLSSPESGCPQKPNRKEVFAIKEIQELCFKK